MNRKLTRRSRLGVSALGLAIVIPLLATSASAAPGDGFFKIKSVEESTGITGIAGNISTAANPGGGGTENPGGGGTENPGGGGTENPGGGTDNPGSGENPADAVVASYSCGPLTLNITQEMIDFSKANEDLFNAGRAGEMVAHADGWKIIASYYNSKFSTGLPPVGTAAGLVALGSDLTGSGVATYMGVSADNCTLTDNRVAPSESATYRYSATPNGAETLKGEGRWITEEGKLNRVLVTESAAGEYVVNREARSDRLPFYMNTGATQHIRYLPLQVVDNVDRVFITVKPDGAIDYSFQDSAGKNALRSNGPVVLQLDATGKIVAHTYMDANGIPRGPAPKGATNAEIIANYNLAAKQNWDGSFPKLTDLDLTIPFQPQAL